MKKKKLKKLAVIIDEINRKNEKISYERREVSSDEFHVECSDELRLRVYNLVCGLFEHRDKISFTLTDDIIECSGNLDIFNNVVSYDENYIHISINKKGFRVNKSRMNLHFKDVLLFPKLYKVLAEKNRQTSIESLNSLIDDVLVLTKISRECNLDELLSEN